MQPAYRLLSAIFAILALIFAAVLLALALGWAIPLAYLQPFLSISDNRLIVVIVSIVVILLALLLITMSTHGRPRFRELLIQDSTLGRVGISEAALQDMILRTARHIREIREIKSFLRHERDGLVVVLHLKVHPDANIPELSQEVQLEVQKCLEEKAAIHVQNVQVLVEGVSYEHQSKPE
jgi:uncharacterized alkaline shock family protein YloU